MRDRPDMDEKTLEFLLESQAKTELRLDRITDLLQAGINMVVDFQAAVPTRSLTASFLPTNGYSS